MHASEHLGLALQIATVTVPVAMYFLVLGLLNSRSHPQMLSARCDFLLLIAAIAPIFVLPALGWLGVSVLTVVGALTAVVLAALLLLPRGQGWVIYNLTCAEANAVIVSSLESLGLEMRAGGNGLVLTGTGAEVRVNPFPLLRNVSVRLYGADDDLARSFAAELAVRLRAVRSETSPMAAAMLTIATAMLAVPAALTAGRAVEIVRILTDLLD